MVRLADVELRHHSSFLYKVLLSVSANNKIMSCICGKIGTSANTWTSSAEGLYFARL